MCRVDGVFVGRVHACVYRADIVQCVCVVCVGVMSGVCVYDVDVNWYVCEALVLCSMCV